VEVEGSKCVTAINLGDLANESVASIILMMIQINNIKIRLSTKGCAKV
jgi:hypothetical protein